MNAYKKTMKKRQEWIDSMSDDERKEFNIRDRILKRANELHRELFPEEYDFIYDSYVDNKDRKMGINPMSEEYIKQTNKRRNEIGIPNYNVEDGFTKESLDYCMNIAEKEIRGSE